MTNVSDRNWRENQNTHFVYSNYFRKKKKINAVYEIMYKNTVESETPQMTVRRMPFAYLLAKATNTLSEYVIYIAFPLQQWLHERALMLRYTYTVFC
jgi:hypothetical protein